MSDHTTASQDGFLFDLRFWFTTIWIVESLGEDDYRCGKELFDDVLQYRQMMDSDFFVKFETVRSRKELFALLDQVEEDLRRTGNIPLLHFDTHGCKEGIEVNSGDSNDVRDLVRYEDLFPKLQRLNVLTRNNLFVTVAACEGAHLHKIVQPTDRSPFWGILGPTESISAGCLFAAYKALYESQLRDPDLKLGIECMRRAAQGYSGRFAFLSSEYMFLKAFKRYIDDFCNLDVAHARVQEWLIKRQAYFDCDPIQGTMLAKNRLEYLTSPAGQREQFERYARHFFLHDLYPRDLNLPRPKYEDAMRLTS